MGVFAAAAVWALRASYKVQIVLRCVSLGRFHLHPGLIVRAKDDHLL